jgi:hypothetical protein
MLNPIRNLKGKLNHLRLPSVQLLAATQLANCIHPSTSNDFASSSVDYIQSLKSNSSSLNPRTFHKL